MPFDGIHRERIEVRGNVQGVGFRPYVYSLATQFGLRGFVRNHSQGVTIEIEGLKIELASFVEVLTKAPPPLARIDLVETAEMTPEGSPDFRIIESATIAASSTPVPPDVATCDECLAELNDIGNRRYRYPFINCTNCGPRYTLVKDIPYDRPLTTMQPFPMCEVCEREYLDPTDRRFHAQPNACPICGPTVWLIDAKNCEWTSFLETSPSAGKAAIASFHSSIERQEIVAIRGVGGFHLTCAAESSAAIATLRKRKGRVDKPLAVMVADIQSARQYAFVSEEEERLLTSRQRPIVLLKRKRGNNLSELIAPGNNTLGVLLPYSPLHAMLVERKPLVMTSGNVSDEPIARTNREAFERLMPLADAFLLHNREIHAACDDSVVRVFQGGELPIRRSRGFAPLPIRCRDNMPNVLAVGGELKATFCLTSGSQAYLSPHIGDMGNLETLDAFQRNVDHFQTLFRLSPEIVACDMHPGYASSQWARELAQSKGLKLLEVQHHHAHIASVLAEHKYDPDKSVIGISFDGTGYGADGAVWGGEVLLASCREYRRWAHLNYVPLPGGDAGIKHPYRSALAHLWAVKLPWDERLPCVADTTKYELDLLRVQLQREINCPRTSSVGRLFDAVAALVGVRRSVNYEGQAAIEMEALSSNTFTSDSYPFTITGHTPYVIETKPLLEAICADVIDRVQQATIIGRFHRTLVEIVVTLCRRAHAQEGLNDVALSGGVFQNVLLLNHVVERLEKSGFNVLTHRLVPPNDGGLALGQAIVAATQSASNST